MTAFNTLQERHAAVLIVDDDPLAIEVLAEALGSDYEIRFATNGAQALEMLRGGVPELLLLDMLLPDTDGYALYAHLKEMPATRDLPVIFVTSMRDPVSEAKGLEMGAADYITKPISPPIVRARVRNHIELARARAGLLASRDEALAAARAKSVFLATMSHEIRTPLNGVIGMAGLLQGTELNDSQRAFVDTIRVSGDALLALIDDILDFSKIDSGKMTLESKPLQPRLLIEDAFEILSAKAREKGLELVYAIEPDVPAAIEGDATRLRQIMINLVGNAVKFTEHGEIRCEVRQLQAAAGDGPATLEFRVSDNGIGIAPDRAGALFDPFTQADSSTTRVYGGTGLGLAICKRLVLAMGGTIAVDSTPGHGSTFRFTLPCRAAALPESLQTQAARAGFGGRRVLIVDGNAVRSQMLRRDLEAWGMTAVVVQGTQGALTQLALPDVFDLAIIDARLPDGDGKALAQTIRAIGARQGLPLILLSSVIPTTAPAQPPVQARLTKPARLSHWFEAVGTALGVPAARVDQPGNAPLDTGLAAKYPLNVLVADDNAVNRKVAEATLARFGYHPQFAENGREAVNCVAQAASDGKRFDVIFMDVQMPVLDGLDATRIIKSRHGADAPVVIAMTAAASPEDKINCFQAGMDDYASKPVNARELQATISRWGARLHGHVG